MRTFESLQSSPTDTTISPELSGVRIGSADATNYPPGFEELGVHGKSRVYSTIRRKEVIHANIKLAGELYSSTSAVVEQRDEIAKRNKIPFRESNQTYIVLPQKDQDFLWDLIEYHPKAAEKKQVIKSFVYGFVAERNFSGLLVLQHDGKLDSFSQQKPIKAITEI